MMLKITKPNTASSPFLNSITLPASELQHHLVKPMSLLLSISLIFIEL